MTLLVGENGAPNWAYVVQRPPTSAILGYLATKWLEYENEFSGIGEPFANRSEPVLTEGFAAFLDREFYAKHQPFDGEFCAERQRVDLGVDGKRLIIGRTDIEWRLFGSPNFIVEFKVVGNGRPARAYVVDGMARFVDGRYGPLSIEGAMWAFFRPGSTEVASHIEAAIDANVLPLRSQPENGNHRIAPSTIAPGTASFDSMHLREPIAPNIRLAHIFVDIRPTPRTS
jgi:hypothetical protein